jgi:predicted metal-dependent phosphoesterase TrpH
MPIALEPLVIPGDRLSSLHLTGLTPHTRYIVHVRGLRQHGPGIEYKLTSNAEGSLSLKGTWAASGEYAFNLLGDASTVRLAFYVVPSDLHARRPLRCDFHIHTHYSDGNSSPAQMVIRGRELGLDVAVITDHDRYTPSLEAMAAVRRLRLGLITGPGEEVSGPNWHVVAINADASIHDLGIESHRLEGDAAWTYDALRWAVRTTQAHGGRAYLAHPYWAIERGYHLPSPWYDRALAEGFLDGIELLGDVKHENNARSLARYLDFRASGSEIPIVSNSDTHGAEHTYGTYWTLVFAQETTLDSVLEAISGGWSVACTTAGRIGEHRSKRLWALGSFELVDYAYFLEQQFFPRHDLLCEREAALANRAWRGEALSEGEMAAQKAAMNDLYAHCWANEPPNAVSA